MATHSGGSPDSSRTSTVAATAFTLQPKTPFASTTLLASVATALAGQHILHVLEQYCRQSAPGWDQPEAREQGNTLRAPAAALRSIKRARLLPQGLGHSQGYVQRHVQHFGGRWHDLGRHKQQKM
jgi:hypothetical protein